MRLDYLASPYSLYPYGQEAAFADVAKIAARLIRDGRCIYSPILHTHPIAKFGDLDPLDHGLWLKIDEANMERCDGLIVARMPGWDKSKGVRFEIEWFYEHKGVLPEYVDPA